MDRRRRRRISSGPVVSINNIWSVSDSHEPQSKVVVSSETRSHSERASIDKREDSYLNEAEEDGLGVVIVPFS